MNIPVLPFTKYAPIESETIYVPHLLCNPDLRDTTIQKYEAQMFLGKYSSNSGTAFGLTHTEAILHAVMESIERHTLSSLFLALIGKGTPERFFYIPENKTDSIVGQLNLDIQLPPYKLFGSKSEGGTYFFVAVETQSKKKWLNVDQDAL